MFLMHYHKMFIINATTAMVSHTNTAALEGIYDMLCTNLITLMTLCLHSSRIELTFAILEEIHAIDISSTKHMILSIHVPLYMRSFEGVN